MYSMTVKQLVLVSKKLSFHLMEIVFYRPKQIVLLLCIEGAGPSS